MVTGKSGYSSAKARKLAAARAAVRKAAATMRGRTTTSLRAPLRTGGWYGLYDRRGRTELKVIDTDNIQGAISSIGTFTLINGVAQGTDYTARIGRKITMRSILIRLFFYPSSTVSAPIGDIIRVIVFFDSQTNGAAPAITDLLNTNAYDSPMNLNNRDRFRVITDKYMTMNANTYTTGAPTAGSPVTRHCKIWKKMGLETIFGATGGSVGSIQSGSLYLLIMNAVNNASQVDSYSRVRFVDN